MYGRPGLVRRRPLLRAAAIGGTFAAGRATGRRAAAQADAAAYQDDSRGQQYGQPAQAAEAVQGGDTAPASPADQLSQLAELHQQGALTDEEFAAAKAKILGG